MDDSSPRPEPSGSNDLAGNIVGLEGSRESRSFIGLHVTSNCRRADGALVRIFDRGAAMRLANVKPASIEISQATGSRYQRLRACRFESPGEAAKLASELAEVEAELVSQLMETQQGATGGPLAVGVSDPGLWHLRSNDRSQFTGLCDASRLAAATGQNVIDGFASGDLASGGQGGPISAMPLWVLFRSPTTPRLLIDLGRTARLTYLPPSHSASALSEILSFDVGPGTNLLDYLALRFSDGKIEFDPGGRLAVQGRSIDKLIEHWLADSYFDQPLPRWNPVGVQPYEELEESVRMAAETGWSVRDLLCTATHFIVRSILRDIERRIPDSPQVTEVVLTGGGSLNGLLLSELTARLPGVTWLTTRDLKIPDGSLDATVGAILAAFHVDRTPGNLPSVTGAETSRVLGRLTPGSPANWNRLLDVMRSAGQADHQLRPAV